MGSGKKGGKYSASTSKTTTTKEDQIRVDVKLNIEDYLKEKGEKAARDRRSILYAEEIGEILAKLPAGTKIYTGETTALAVINGKDEIGVPTFFVKISDGQYSRYKRFGTDDYTDVYGASIGEDIIRGYRLKKLKLRFE